MGVYADSLKKEISDLEKLVCEKRNPVKKFNKSKYDPDFALMMLKTTELLSLNKRHGHH